MSSYNAAEVIQFAIRIEENGARYYRALAQRFAMNEEMAAFFNNLAGQEGDHQVFFKEMAARLGRSQTEAPLTEEYFLYLRGFADRTIFDESAVVQSENRFSTVKQAIIHCMERELEAVHYYRELKKLVPEAEHQVLDDIIGEEQNHFQQLEQRMKSLSMEDVP